MKKQIPNMFTISRIILVIIASYFLINKNIDISIILLTIAALTDFFDGYFARKLDAKSVLGVKLDQLSDKLFSFLICISLIILGNKYLIFTLLVEVIFSIIVSIQALKIKEWREATKYGKFKITFVFITIIMGVVILKFKELKLLFIIIWALTLIIQILANYKITKTQYKEIKHEK